MEDFEDPYSCCWIYQDYLGEQLVDGIHYEIRICRTDFSMFQTFDDEKPFLFYMLIQTDDDFDNKVGSYIAAKEMYAVDDVDETDFRF